MGTPSIDTGPTDAEIARKQQKERDKAAIAEERRRASTGRALHEMPSVKGKPK